MTRRRRWAVAGGLVVALAAAGVLLGTHVRRLTHIGAGLVAKQMCSCVFVDGRDAASCRNDLPPETAPVQALIDESERSVRAWVPVLAERSARYRDGTGCTLY